MSQTSVPKYIPAVKVAGSHWKVLKKHFLGNPAAAYRLAQKLGTIEIIHDRYNKVLAVLSVPRKRARRKRP